MGERKIPADPMICLSFVNMKLRDGYVSLEAFCEDFGIEEAELQRRLEAVGFIYDRENNQFR